MKDAAAVLAALGGAENITELEPCITRMRVRVLDADAVDDAQLAALGAKGVVRTGQTVQIVVGPIADQLTAQVAALAGSLPSDPHAPVGDAARIFNLDADEGWRVGY